MLNGRITAIEAKPDRLVFTINGQHTLHLYDTPLARGALVGDHIWTQGFCAYLTTSRPEFSVHDARLWLVRQDAGGGCPWPLQEAMAGKVLTSTGER